VLTIAGTTGDDAILIIPKGKPRAQNATVKVFINGVNLGIFTGVHAATIYALAGNDFVHLAGSIRVPATVYGDAGNDRIKGGAGADLLVGGDGNDWLNGHTGNDVLIGGAGADRLLGGPGDDLLIAGATTYDADAAALLALQQSWLASGKTYEQHVAALLDPTAIVHLIADGTTPTVLDDGAADRLTGAAGKDWFFATVPQDVVTDRHSFEYLNGAKGNKPGNANHGNGNGNGGNGQGHGNGH
jgi:Ca2+-binding RTX toxin-like protein